jgi:hypothetical protein
VIHNSKHPVPAAIVEYKMQGNDVHHYYYFDIARIGLKSNFQSILKKSKKSWAKMGKNGQNLKIVVG